MSSTNTKAITEYCNLASSLPKIVYFLRQVRFLTANLFPLVVILSTAYKSEYHTVKCDQFLEIFRHIGRFGHNSIFLVVTLYSMLCLGYNK